MTKTDENTKEKIIKLIIGSPGMGGGEDFYSFVDKYYANLHEPEKELVNKILVELIDDNKAWGKQIGHLGEKFVFEQKTKAIYICSELNLIDITPKIEKFLTIKNLNRKFNLSLFHHAIGKFKIDSAISFLERQVEFLLSNYKNDEFAWSEKYTEQFNAISALYALLKINPEKAFSYILKSLKIKTRYDDSRIEAIIYAFKNKYNKNWLEFLSEATKDNSEKITQILYALGGIGVIKSNTPDLMEYFNTFDKDIKEKVEKKIVQNIDGEISANRYPLGSISLCGILKLKSAVPKLVKLTELVNVKDIYLEPLIIAFGELEVKEAKNFIEGFANEFYFSYPFNAEQPEFGPDMNIKLQRWNIASSAVLALMKIEPENGLFFIKKCLETEAEDLIVQRLIAIENSFQIIKERLGKKAYQYIIEKLKKKRSRSLIALKKVIEGELVKNLKIQEALPKQEFEHIATIIKNA